jgi:hypothetical protein
MTLLMLPAADTSVTPRLAAGVLSRSVRWSSMTGGPAATKGIAIFSIAAQGSADKNRSWERSLSNGRAYVNDLCSKLPGWISMLSVCFWILCAKAAPSMKRRELSTAVRCFPDTLNPSRVHPHKWIKGCQVWRKRWPSMRTLTTNSTASTEVFGYTSKDMRRRTVVLPALLVWPERNVRTPKEMVSGPVRNAGCSLMLHVPENEFYNLLFTDKSAVSCSRKAMME